MDRFNGGGRGFRVSYEQVYRLRGQGVFVGVDGGGGGGGEGGGGGGRGEHGIAGGNGMTVVVHEIVKVILAEVAGSLAQLVQFRVLL